MRAPRKTLFLTLILLTTIIQPFLAIVIPVAYAEQEQLWCVNFDFTYNEWDEKGVSPYLHDTGTDLLKTKNIGAKEGNFGFSYSSESGTINSVTLYMEGKSKGGNVKIYVSDDDGYSFIHEGNIIFEKDWLYKTLDLSIKLDTWIKINSAKIYIICQEKGDGKSLEIRRAYLHIDYETEPEPSWEHYSFYREIETFVWMPDETPFKAYFDGSWHIEADILNLQVIIDDFLDSEPEPEPDPEPGWGESEGDYIDSWDISSESGDALSLTTDGTNIWILDYADDYVYKYNMIGEYVDSWDIYYSAGSDDAFGITTDGSNIWIADYGDSEIYKFTMAGVYVDSWDTSAQSTWLYGIATDGNYIWILDYFAKEVYKYSMAGVYTDEHWDTSGQSTDTTEITTDGDYFWTVSPDDAEVYRYHMNGTYITSWDISVQSDDGYGVTTDGICIWIVDHVDDEVYKYEGLVPPPPPTPPDPINLFGAGFNASMPYVELCWTHNLTDTDFFEVQNSTDKISWDYLGQNTTTQYTDFQVVNGTERYYKVRACNYEAVGGWANSSFSNVNFETVYFVEAAEAPAAVNVPQIDRIEFNTTVTGELCGISGDFSDVEGLSGYIFWNNATSPPGGVNSSFTALAGTSDSALENITLPSSGTKVGVKYYVNDTDGNWAVNTLIIFPTAPIDVPQVNYPAINEIVFNTTIAETICEIYGAFSDAEGLSGYIFWNNATSAPGGVNSSFTALTGVSNSTLEAVTLPVSGTQFGVAYYVNDTDGNWATDTLIIFPTAAVDAPQVNYPVIDVIKFNTTIAGDRCGVYGAFSDVEGLSGYIFWNNATSAPGGVNSSFTALAGTSDYGIENITLPISGTLLGVKYYVNDTDNKWAVDTLVIFPTILNQTEACKTYSYTASSISIIAGNLNDGDLSSTHVVDGDWYNVSEVAEIPGLDVRFNFTNILGDPNCGCLDVYHSYTGHPQHDIQIHAWNFTSLSWYQIGTLIYNETAGWECSGLGNDAEHFFQNGSFWGRFYHIDQGHVPHEIQIDRINLDVIYGEECPECPPVGAGQAGLNLLSIFVIFMVTVVVYAVKRR